MANNNTPLALALGAGAGLGLWALLRDDDDAPTTATSAATSASEAPTAPAPCSLRLDAKGLTTDGAIIDIPTAVIRCQAAGRADLVLADDAPTSAYADLGAAFTAAGILINLRNRNRRNTGRSRRRRQAAPRYKRDGRTILRDGQAVLHLERVDLGDQRFAITPHEADVLAQKIVELLNGARRQSATSASAAASTHRIFLFRTMPKNGNRRTRWYMADPPTTWEDAKRRIVGAGLLDERILLPTEWALAVDPPSPLRVPTDRLRPLP